MTAAVGIGCLDCTVPALQQEQQEFKKEADLAAGGAAQADLAAGGAAQATLQKEAWTPANRFEAGFAGQE